MMRPPLPTETDAPREPMVILVRTWADGRVTRELLPASVAGALCLYDPRNGDEIMGARILYPQGVADLFGQSV